MHDSSRKFEESVLETPSEAPRAVDVLLEVGDLGVNHSQALPTILPESRDTKERPYQCPVYRKHASRSNVLRRYHSTYENLNETRQTFSKRPTNRREDHPAWIVSAPTDNVLGSTDSEQEQFIRRVTANQRVLL